MRNQPSLLLIRHAQSQNNALDDSLRIPDPRLTPLGIRQAQKLGLTMPRMAPTVLFCSPFLRSLETTAWIARTTNITPIVRQDIYEQGGCHRGYAAHNRVAEPGLSRSQLNSLYPGWNLDERISEEGWYDLDHYETEAEAAVRARRVRGWFEDELRQRLANDRVAMVIHADFKLRLLEAFLERDDLEHWLGDVINTSITQISRHSNGRWRLDYWNSFEHLDNEEISK